MTDKPLRSKQIYLLVISSWLAFVSILAVIIVKSSIQSSEDSFKTKSMSLLHMVKEQAYTKETLLEGFAASVSVIGL